MSPSQFHLEPLTPEAFAPYGQVLQRDPNNPEPFQPLFTAPSSTGWRVAILEVRPGPLTRLHRHPDSEECFSPLTGSAGMAVALPESPDQIRVFRLDRPICMRRHVWHQVVSLEEKACTLFIAENATITGESCAVAL